jgi:hypothetical protein
MKTKIFLVLPFLFFSLAAITLTIQLMQGHIAGNSLVREVDLFERLYLIEVSQMSGTPSPTTNFIEALTTVKPGTKS